MDSVNQADQPVPAAPVKAEANEPAPEKLSEADPNALAAGDHAVVAEAGSDEKANVAEEMAAEQSTPAAPSSGEIPDKSGAESASSIGGDKPDSDSTDNTSKPDQPEADKLADESAEVKMETSTTEDKSTDEKAQEETTPANSTTNLSSNNTTTTTTTQPPAAVANNQPAVAAPHTETKETISDKQQAPIETKTPSPAENTKTMGTRQYLDATVVPILHTALSHLAKQRPENPVGFLGQFLLDNQDKFNSK